MTMNKLLIAIALGTFIVAGCGKDPVKPNPDPGPDNPPVSQAPEITSFAPNKIMPGGEVIIQGKRFKDNITQNTVSFNGTVVNGFVSAASTTQLTVRVPQDATTGKLIVKVGNLSDTTATDLVIDPTMISVAGFTPATGPIGTPVTISGINFGLNTEVKMNGVACSITNRTNTSLTILIPLNTSLTKHKFEVINGTYNLQTQEEFTVSGNGPTAHWNNLDRELFPNNATAYHFGISFVHQNKIYWGFTRIVSTETTSSYAVYDPAQPTKGWVVNDQLSQSMAPANLTMATAIVHDNRVFIGTGFISTSGNQRWWEFDPATGNGRQLTDFPHAAPNTISFVMKNKIYVGFGSGNKSLYEFDPAGNSNLGSWTLKATHDLQELNSGNALVLGNEVIFGRALPALNQPRQAILKYTEGGQLTRIADMPQDLTSITTPAFTIGNKGYFVINKNVWEYTPDAAGGTWRVVLGGDTQPAIKYVGALSINNTTVIYGWTGSGHLYEFKF